MSRVDAEERSNQRLVFVVRVLLLCICVGGVTALPLMFWQPQGALLGGVLSVGFSLLMVVYLGVLWAASREHWSLARRALFSAWVVYPSLLVLLYRPDLSPLLGTMVLCVAALVVGVIEVGILTLSSWREGRWWIVATLLLYSLCSIFVAVVWSANPFLFLAVFFLCVIHLLAILFSTFILLRDLQGALARSDTILLDALQLKREAAYARDQALAANTAKSRFLATMSHELRTPLNAILGYSELIQDEVDDLGVEGLDADLRRIHSSGAHLLGLINAILDLSKIEAGKMEITIDRVVPGDLFREVVSTIRPLAQEKQLEIRADYPEIRPVMTDSQKLRQVLLNLLSNAVKFTDAGSLELWARVEGGSLVIKVTDSGVGITRERLTKVFEAFERTEAEVTTRVGGTGLGLAISKHICELLGGTLRADSQVGRGSTFTVCLPVIAPKRRRSSIDELRTDPTTIDGFDSEG